MRAIPKVGEIPITDSDYEDRKHPARLEDRAYRTPGHIVFITVRASNARGLTDPNTFDALIATMRSIGARRNVVIRAYCVMPDHIHLVASVKNEDGDLQKFMRYFKRETARKIERAGMWERSFWDRHARADEDVAQMVEYTLNNPVRKAFCDKWQEWAYSWSEWHGESRGPDPNRC